MSFNGSFFQDQDGFFWIASQSGLLKWDGLEVRPLQGSPDNVLSAYEDREGLIWIIGVDSLSVYDKSTGSITTFEHDPADPTSIAEGVFRSFVQPISEDSAGNIWFGTQQGLSKYERATGTFAHYVHDPGDHNSLIHDAVLAVLVDSEDKVWVGTTMGLDEFDPATGTFTHYQSDPSDPATLVSNHVKALLEDHNGILWAGTESGGLSRVDRKTGTVTRFLHDPDDPDPRTLVGSVTAITEARPDELWIATIEGLNVLDVKSGAAYHYAADPADPDSLSTDGAKNVYLDSSGIIWVVQSGGILDKVDPNSRKFAVYQNHPQNDNSLAANVVSSVFQDRQGIMWFGLLGKGLDSYDRTTRTFTHYPGAPGGTGESIFEDRGGLFWVTGEGGIFSFDRRTGTYSQLYPLESQWGTAIVPDPHDQGILWVGTSQAGLVKFDTMTKQAEYFRHDPSDPASVSSDMLWHLIADEAGYLWIPTSAGLDRFDPGTGEVVEHYQSDPDDPRSLGSDAIHAAYIDSAGLLWLGTDGGGLERMNADGTFTHFDRANGFPVDSVGSIVQDDLGLLWLGTKIGLVRFDPVSGASRIYTKDDGLVGDMFWQLPTLKASDGEIWVFDGSGANSFYPDQVRDNPHKPPVYFTALTRDGEPLEGLVAAPERVTEIRLDWRNNSFEFEVAALDFTRPEKNQYEYILEGLDRNWYKAGTEHSGRYSSLPSGTFTLRVRGSNSDGVWGDSEAVLTVIVVGPFWKAAWFIALLTVTGAGLLAGFSMWRMHAAVQRRRHLEQQVAERTAELRTANDELEAFAYSVSHDLQTPLRAISGFSEILAARHRAGLDDEGRHYLDNVVQAGGRMQLLIDHLLDYSRLGRSRLNLRPVALRNVLAPITVELASRAQQAGATIEIADDLAVVEGDETLLGEVFTNLLENALQYRRPDVPTRITVTSRLEGDTAIVAVADNGIGIPPESLERVFDVFERLHGQDEYPGTGIGLATVRKSVQLLKGSVWVESEVGRGSTFFVRLPRSRT